MAIIRYIISGLLILALVGCGRPHYQGYIEGEYINLASNYSGILKQLLILRGDLVKKDQLLFVLDSEPEAAELAQAKDQLLQAQKTLDDIILGQRNTVLQGIVAQREQAQANMDLAAKTLQRYQTLYAQGAIAKQNVDQAQADYDQYRNQVNQYTANLKEAKLGARDNAIKAQEAAVEAAQANVDKYAWQLAQKSLVAPTDARVFDTYYKVGEFVNSQQPVAALLAPQDIKLIFYMPEPQRSELAVGQMVEFTCDACKGRTTAKINYIAPEAEYTPPVIYSRESRGKLVYRVEAHMKLEDAKHFYPGQPIEVYLAR